MAERSVLDSGDLKTVRNLVSLSDNVSYCNCPFTLFTQMHVGFIPQQSKYLTSDANRQTKVLKYC